jgi:hypothetical protein
MNTEKVHLGQNAVQHVARARLGSGVGGGLSKLYVVHLARDVRLMVYFEN